MRSTLFAAAAAWILTAPAIAGVVDDARSAVRAQLKDPGSAQFDQVKAGAGAVCGRVNARTPAGGYAGPTLFVYVAGSREAFILDPASTAGPAWAGRAIAAYRKHCGG